MPSRCPARYQRCGKHGQATNQEFHGLKAAAFHASVNLDDILHDVGQVDRLANVAET